MLSCRVVGSKEVLDRYEKMQKSIPPLIYKTMLRACLEVSRTTKKDYLTGPRPRKLAVGKTGWLRSSVNVLIKKKIKEIIGVIGARPWYGKMWETRPQGTFKDGSPKQRPFLGPALEQSRAKIRQIFDRAGAELVK